MKACVQSPVDDPLKKATQESYVTGAQKGIDEAIGRAKQEAAKAVRPPNPPPYAWLCTYTYVVQTCAYAATTSEPQGWLPSCTVVFHPHLRPCWPCHKPQTEVFFTASVRLHGTHQRVAVLRCGFLIQTVCQYICAACLSPPGCWSPLWPPSLQPPRKDTAAPLPCTHVFAGDLVVDLLFRPRPQMRSAMPLQSVRRRQTTSPRRPPRPRPLQRRRLPPASRP